MQLLNRVIFQDQSADMLSRRETLDFLVWAEEEEEEEEEITLCHVNLGGRLDCIVKACWPGNTLRCRFFSEL